MRDNKELRKRNQHPANTGNSASTTFLKIVGGAALMTVAAVVILSLPDIKQYIKISSM